MSALIPSRFRRALRLGMRSLWLHRLRSLLTVLGIVFGVCSVIAMLAIGEGASFAAQEQIRNMGSQNVILKSIKPPEEQKVENQRQEGWSLEYGLKHADMKAIRATIPDIELIVPARVIREYVWNVSQRFDTEVVATVPWYPSMRNHRVEQGRFFSEYDDSAAEAVCVLGHNMARALFPLESPLGKDVRVGVHYYRVIGVMEPRAKSSATDSGPAGMQAAGDRMFIPLETARRRYGQVLWTSRQGSDQSEKVELHEVTVKVSKPERVQVTAQVIEDLLKRNHKKKDYEVVVPLELLREAERSKRIFSLVLGSIAAISLVVGGIGIMNIMLATVTERTREIGIRRALGARRQDITTQFLIESTMLSAAGGAMGVILGLAIPFAVTHFAGMKTIVTFWSPVLAFSISAVVGILFGLYPALRAASMDPVDALRHE